MVVSTTAAAQSTFPYEWSQELYSPDSTLGGEFGVNMAVVDMNFDGFGDLIATDAQKSANGVMAAGKTFILLGPTLNTHVAVVASAPAATEKAGWTSLSIDDANGDGEYDILVGSPGYDASGPSLTDYGRAHLFLGPDFSTDIVFNPPLPEQHGEFGIAVQLADLDGDGLDEVAIGAHKQSGAVVVEHVGRAWVWRGSDLTAPPTELLLPKPTIGSVFGQHMAAVPGAVGENLLVAAPGYTLPGGQVPTGCLFRYGGASFSLIDVVAPPAWPLFQFSRLRGLVDLDGDGFGDLIASQLDGMAGAAVLAGPDYKSALQFFDDDDLDDLLFAKYVSMADLDRDGDQDAVISDQTWSAQESAILVRWGPAYHVEDVLGPGWFPYSSASLGNGLAVGDVDGDGYDEIFAQMVAGFSGGIVQVFRRKTLQASAPSLSISAGDSISFTLDLPPDQAGHGYLVALSVSEPESGLVLGTGSYIPLFPDAMTAIGISLLGTAILEGFAGTLDAQGDAALRLHWPANKGAGFAGSTLHVAGIAATATGLPGPGTNEVTISLLP